MRKTLLATAAVAALGLAAVAALPPLAAWAEGGMHHGQHHRGGPMHGDSEGGYGMHGGHGMRGGHGMGEGRGHGMRGQRRMMELIEQFDADGDGGVTQAEIDQGRAARLAEFDADGNGTLSLEEYQALWLDAMRERMVDRFQAHDDDGDGQVTPEEFGERMSHMVMMRDRNGDGVLNLDDTGPRGGPGMGRGPRWQPQQQ